MKKGFTLAEALITIGIIGVIASLTLPNLNASVSAQKAGPALAKAINTLENVNKKALSENDARNLTSLGCPDGYINILVDHVVGSKSGDNNYISKDGIEYIMGTSGTASKAPSNYYGSYKVVNIDINGTKKSPNKPGKDIFRVYVDMNGNVIPYGGLQYKDYTQGAAAIWSTKCNGDTITDPYSCTGSIADNAWSVKYRYQIAGANVTQQQ